jgi:hypothetical protein
MEKIVTPPSPESPIAISSSPKKTSTLIFAAILCASVIGAFFAGQYVGKKSNPPSITPPSPTSSPAPSPSIETEKYRRSGIEFEYPIALHELINSQEFSISIQSKQSVITERTQEGPQQLSPETVTTQLDWLEGINNLSDCTVSEQERKQLDGFILATRAINFRLAPVEVIRTQDGICAVKIVESDGFDVSLANYAYKVVFVKNDNLIILHARLFPTQSVPASIAVWTGFGYDFSKRSCDADCSDKEIAYIRNISPEDPLIKQVINLYDELVSTLSYSPEPVL